MHSPELSTQADMTFEFDTEELLDDHGNCLLRIRTLEDEVQHLRNQLGQEKQRNDDLSAHLLTSIDKIEELLEDNDKKSEALKRQSEALKSQSEAMNSQSEVLNIQSEALKELSGARLSPETLGSQGETVERPQSGYSASVETASENMLEEEVVGATSSIEVVGLTRNERESPLSWRDFPVMRYHASASSLSEGLSTSNNNNNREGDEGGNIKWRMAFRPSSSTSSSNSIMSSELPGDSDIADMDGDDHGYWIQRLLRKIRTRLGKQKVGGTADAVKIKDPITSPTKATNEPDGPSHPVVEPEPEPEEMHEGGGGPCICDCDGSLPLPGLDSDGIIHYYLPPKSLTTDHNDAIIRLLWARHSSTHSWAPHMSPLRDRVWHAAPLHTLGGAIEEIDSDEECVRFAGWCLEELRASASRVIVPGWTKKRGQEYGNPALDAGEECYLAWVMLSSCLIKLRDGQEVKFGFPKEAVWDIGCNCKKIPFDERTNGVTELQLLQRLVELLGVIYERSLGW